VSAVALLFDVTHGRVMINSDRIIFSLFYYDLFNCPLVGPDFDRRRPRKGDARRFVTIYDDE
jgi:hypothetical protein